MHMYSWICNENIILSKCLFLTFFPRLISGNKLAQQTHKHTHTHRERDTHTQRERHTHTDTHIHKSTQSET